MKRKIFILAIITMFTACGDPLAILGVNRESDSSDVSGLFPREGFNGPGELSIEQVDPDEGPVKGGTRLQITGTGFVTGIIVLIGQEKGVEPVVENKNSITVTTPPHNPGVVDIRLITPDNRMAIMPRGFTYKADIEINTVNPNKLPVEGGVPIIINGSGFDSTCLLYIRGRRSPKINIVSSKQITAIAPDNDPGPASVVVACELGEGDLRNAVQYVAPAKIEGCSPISIPGNQNACVVVRGTGMKDAISAMIDNKKIGITNPTQNRLNLCFNAGDILPGKHDVTIITPGGHTTDTGCFMVYKKSGQTPPGIMAVIPDSGPINRVQRCAVVVNGLEGSGNNPIISFGNQVAGLLNWDPSQQRLVVNTPSGTKTGPVDVTARWGNGEYRLKRGYTYYAVPTISGITPSSGPVTGYTDVDITGTGLGQVDEVRFGPLPGILNSVSDRKVMVTTPTGAPGPVTLRIHTSDGQKIEIETAFSFFDKGIALNAVYPSSGAVCGGAHINLYGAGFTKDTKFFFGDNRAFPVSADTITPSRAGLILPPGTVGPVDISVKWPDNKTLIRHNKFVYFDPTAYYGGTWGKPIEQAVNVVVKEDQKGKHIPNAFVLIGNRTETGLQGYTDDNGMLTLWNENLHGPIEITAVKKGYSAASLIGVDAENITLFLTSHTPTSGGGTTSGTPVPDGVITGRVTGIAKGILPPPEDCAKVVLDQQPQCLPCQPAQGCDDDRYTCADALGTGWYCLKECLTNDDCPTGYSCYGIKYQLSACMPQHGTIRIKCYPAPPSGGWSVSDPGPGFIVKSDGKFGVSSRPGDIAIYCVGGFLTDEGVFKPIAMGVARHIAVQPGQVITGLKIPLNIPMDRTVNINVMDLPIGKDQPLADTMHYYLSLGSDGAIVFWPEITSTGKALFSLTNLPKTLTGPLNDAKLGLSFNAAFSDNNWYGSSSYASLDSFPEGPTIYGQTKNQFTAHEQSLGLDIQAACPDATGRLLLFSQQGLLFVYNPSDQSIEGAQFPYGPQVLACTTPTGGNPLAAAKSGVIWSYQNSAWHQVPTGMSGDLHAISTGGMGTFAVGDNALIDYNHGYPKIIQSPFPAVFNTVTVAKDYVLTAGAKGQIFHYDGWSLSPVRPAPTDQDLTASCTCDGISFLAGANGTVLKYDGTGFTPLKSGMHGTITAVTCGDTTGIWAASDQGEVQSIPLQDEKQPPMRIVSNGFYPTSIPITNPLTIMGKTRISIGPIVWVPGFTIPAPYSAWSGNIMQWYWSGGPAPSFVRFQFNSQKGLTLWNILIRGDILEVTLPELNSSIGFDPFGDENPIQLSILGILSKDFDINAFDQVSAFSTKWISWMQNGLNIYRKP